MLLPGGTIGIVGGGQLGRMLVLEARRMGYRTVVLEPAPDAPASQIADEVIAAPLDDAEAARRLAAASDVVTLEWENANADVIEALEASVPVRPGAAVLRVAQHRVREKEAARRFGLDTADFRNVTSLPELRAALEALGTPALLKTSTGGYDGKGQYRIDSADDAAAAMEALGGEGAELILEAMVPFRMEASVICARGVDGKMATFPIAENIHRNGILDLSIAPARLSEAVLRRAKEAGEAMAEGLGVVGLLAVELFITEDDRVLVNEIAPRPHNSGHYTWEACTISQFEQQLRAVCGLPLGDTSLLRSTAMANLLGEHIHIDTYLRGAEAALAVPGAALHLYGKHDSRPARKMGHITAIADSVDEAISRALAARDRLSGAAS